MLHDYSFDSHEWARLSLKLHADIEMDDSVIQDHSAHLGSILWHEINPLQPNSSNPEDVHPLMESSCPTHVSLSCMNQEREYGFKNSI